jgi:hypothetical protein
MSWWSNIFGTSTKAVDTVANIANGAVSGIDKLFFTEQEKAEFSAKTMQVWLEVQKVTAGESSIKSITRRLLAVAFIVVYLTLILASCIVWQFNPEYAKHVFQTAQTLNTPILTIIIFYFGYYAVSNVIKAKK